MLESLRSHGDPWLDRHCTLHSCICPRYRAISFTIVERSRPRSSAQHSRVRHGSSLQNSQSAAILLPTTLGTDWIEPQPDQWVSSLCRLMAQLRVTLFLSHPERDSKTDTLYNSLFVITADGCIIGSHRKINALRVGSEAWSTPGHRAEPIALSPVGHVGLLICADAYTPAIANNLKAHGAQILVSSAAWAPGLHGPERGMGTVHCGTRDCRCSSATEPVQTVR